MRAVFHEREDADAVVDKLLLQGFESTLARDRFAGEDDDEDHAWTVVTDAPEVVVELLVEEHDGWVDHEQPPVQAAPLDLPDGPRRIKGHFGRGAARDEP